jgi:hypothetical protein
VSASAVRDLDVEEVDRYRRILDDAMRGPSPDGLIVERAVVRLAQLLPVPDAGLLAAYLQAVGVDDTAAEVLASTLLSPISTVRQASETPDAAMRRRLAGNLAAVVTEGRGASVAVQDTAEDDDWVALSGRRGVQNILEERIPALIERWLSPGAITASGITSIVLVTQIRHVMPILTALKAVLVALF